MKRCGHYCPKLAAKLLIFPQSANPRPPWHSLSERERRICDFPFKGLYFDLESSLFAIESIPIKALDGYRDELKPVFKSTPTQFQTIIFASADVTNVGDVTETKIAERQQKILSLIKESPTISGRQMSEILSVSQRTIERDLSFLQKNGILRHESKNNDGAWHIINLFLPLQ